MRKIHSDLSDHRRSFFRDVTYLTSPPILATTEYSNLLRPLRGREPEGMWNLLQIAREMLARHDVNGTQLLDILTRQCLAQEQVREDRRDSNLIDFFCFD